MGENDIAFNVENDLDKDFQVTVYLTKPEREALERETEKQDSTMSDVAGGYIWRGLKAAYQLPEYYSRPSGF